MEHSLIPATPVELERSSLDQSWGFRLQGGADFRLPLSIKKVIPNSPSHNKIHPGDAVALIDGQDASSMTHNDAENLIRNSLRLQLVVRRGQLNTIRPTKGTVKFNAAPNPRTNSALNNTVTQNNYRRF
ncbi:unnamed protein product [Rotaria socialis]|uniref:PDZ domain-containing protein n=2 Tax=Rotaria socialis TaxID=392032 RepID=A0A820KVX4_9BILA|nr:unnamed protein product [Rotaria socialis]CAF3387819.1 unnamed protein product [Rotaria socialis]CAF3691784.1 unnamed protein product [Rotaria socialis]CAF4351064.1 unnamed protein product [Rotaria socialis]CAF4442484.1 unnamed protein product [Rotaria socialis]